MTYHRGLGDVSTVGSTDVATTGPATTANTAFVGFLWLIALVVGFGAVWSAMTDDSDYEEYDDA